MIKEEDSHYKVKFPSWVVNITMKTKHAVFSRELKFSPKKLYFTAFYVRMNQIN